jgi:hypothetical protein
MLGFDIDGCGGLVARGLTSGLWPCVVLNGVVFAGVQCLRDVSMADDGLTTTLLMNHAAYPMRARILANRFRST